MRRVVAHTREVPHLSARTGLTLAVQVEVHPVLTHDGVEFRVTAILGDRVKMVAQDTTYDLKVEVEIVLERDR